MEPDVHASFREWLLDAMRERDWNQSDLARRAHLSRSAISKFLQPPGHPDHRQPDYKSVQAIARALAVDTDTLLRMAGHEPVRTTTATELQRNVMAMIPFVPDEALAVIYPQIRALTDRAIQESMRRQIDAALQSSPPTTKAGLSAESETPQSNEALATEAIANGTRT